ncbi:hypothetical protein, partial [[Eubacterium] cellulosolvens]
MSDINTQQLSNRLTKYFDGKEEVRENALKLAREIAKGSTSIIRKLHSHRQLDLKPLLEQLKPLNSKYKKLTTELKKYPELYYSNMVENYIQEYAEAIIMLNIIRNNLNTTKLPEPEKLGIPYTTYLQGLGDVIGEFRRCTLDALRKNELQDATRYLDAMEELYDFIIDLNYPDRVLPLRRKQDVARALIEKTRGELTFALSEYNLVGNI